MQSRKNWIPESHNFSLMVPTSQPHKKTGNPTLAHYWNSNFPDPAPVFSTHPKYHNKKWPNSPSHQSYCGPSLLQATKGACHLFLVSFPDSVHILGMPVLYWLICMVFGHKGPGVKCNVCLMSRWPCKCTCKWCNNHYYIWFASTHNSGMQGRLFDSPCQPGIYLPRKTKVQPDLSLLQDKFSVRYEC